MARQSGKNGNNKSASRDVDAPKDWTDEGLLEVREVADRLRLSTAKVYTLISTGELAAVAIGRAKRVPAAALRAFMQAQLRGVMPTEAAQ